MTRHTRRLPAWAIAGTLATATAMGAALAAEAPSPAAAATSPAPASPAAASPAAEPASAAKKWDVNHPPGPSATVNLDTRTGTWLSVDVSPDGRKVLFDLLGDLYELPIEGGEAKALTHSMAWEMQARYSPDGRRIAFLSDAGGGDNVWLANADGSDAKQLTHEDFRLLYTPTWSPDGQYVAARKHFTGTRSAGSGEIWLFHVGGGKGMALNDKPNWQKDLGEPAYSRDGHYVYFSQDVTPGKVFEYNKDSNGEIYDIQRLDLRDGTIEPFVTGAGGAVRPVPSPDGKWLAFVRRVRNQTTLFLKDLSTGRETPAWNGLDRDMQETWAMQGVYPSFAWLPDSKTLVTWGQGGKLWRVDPFAHTAAEIPFHVKDTREVRTAIRNPVEVAPADFDVKQLRWAHVSPQGDRVVYSALGHLWLKDLAAGAAPRRLTRATDRFEYYPTFSRDGRSVAFVTWSDAEQGRVRVLDLAGGKETVLTPTPGHYLEPSFSPDGRTVVYVKGKGGYLTTPWNGMDPGVYRVASDGRGAPERIAKSGTQPQFGAANDAVYVTRRSVEKEVELSAKLVRIDLAERFREVEVASSEFATEYAVSPDGRWLGFVERFHAFVTPLPAAAGKPLAINTKMDSLPVRQLDGTSGRWLHWSGDSSALHWTLGDTMHTEALKDAFTFVPGAPAAPDALPTAQAVEARGVRIGFRQKSDTPSGITAFTGARIVTMKGDEVIEDGTIVVDGNRIRAVGRTADVAVPAGATRIDARGKTIIPGLVDVHWHGGMGTDGLVPQQSWIDYASLAFGVTTIHDPSNDSATIFTHSEMQRAGEVVAPRIFSTGTVLYGAKWDQAAVIDSLDDALAHLKRQKAAGAISVKSYNQPRRDQRQQVLEAARQTGLMVVPEGGSMFELNMTMVVDGHTGVEHALPVGHVYDDVKQLWSQTQVGYTPTLNVAYGGLDGEHYWYAHTDVWQHPILKDFVPRAVLQARAVRREIAPVEDYNVLQVARDATAMSRAGVKVNMGAHGQREGLGAHWDMWTEAMGGMTPLEALRTATINGAHYLGMDRDIGSLEPGKLADLVVLDGNPLADIRQSDTVHQVMLNGRLYALPRMDEVGAHPKARQPFFFEGAENVGMPIDATLRDRGDGDAAD